MRKDHADQPQQRGIGNAGNQQQPEGLADAPDVARAEVIADDRLRALRQSLQRQHGELHHGGEDGHRADGDVAAVLQQRGVEADGQHAFGRLHHERGQPQQNAGRDQTRLNAEVAQLQAQHAFFAGDEQHHPYGRHRLRQHRCDCRALYAEVERKNEERVEHDVAERADEHRQHADLRKPLRGDERVHPERELNEQRAERVNAHILLCIADGIFARAEKQQQVAVPDRDDDRQQNRKADEQREAVAHHLFGLFVFTFAHQHRHARRAAHKDKRGERGDEQDQRRADAHAGERQRADVGNMAYVHPVNEVIKHIDQLRRNGGYGQPQRKPSDRLGT